MAAAISEVHLSMSAYSRCTSLLVSPVVVSRMREIRMSDFTTRLLSTAPLVIQLGTSRAIVAARTAARSGASVSEFEISALDSTPLAFRLS